MRDIIPNSVVRLQRTQEKYNEQEVAVVVVVLVKFKGAVQHQGTHIGVNEYGYRLSTIDQPTDGQIDKSSPTS